MWCCLPEDGGWRHAPERERAKHKKWKGWIHEDSESERKLKTGRADWKKEKGKTEPKQYEMALHVLVKERKSARLRQRRGAWSTQSVHSRLADFWLLRPAQTLWYETSLFAPLTGQQRETERGRIINMMHQVLPEKEVSPQASASRISLLETGTERHPALTDWLTDWLSEWVDCVVLKSVCVRQTGRQGEENKKRTQGWWPPSKYPTNRNSDVTAQQTET